MSLNVKLHGIEKNKTYVSSNSSSSPSLASSSTKVPDYGTDSKHGKILKKTTEKDNSGTVTTTEWYEDGYYSTLIMKKCSSCGGTGKSFNGLFCTLCTGGFTVTSTYINPNTGDSYVIHNGSYSGGNSTGYSNSTSGGYSSGSNKNHSGSSVYTKCTDCNGSGRCRHCNGRGTSILTGHSETCVVCNGSGKCKICYGRGKL